MTSWLPVSVPLLTLLLAAEASAQPGTINLLRTQPDQPIRVFSPVEWLIQGPGPYSNPFDPDEVTIDGHFSGPDGRSIVLPAFWSQPFTGNRFGHHDTRKATVNGEGRWLLRFAPTLPGRWTVQVRFKDRTGTRTSADLSFDVAPDHAATGFVHRSTASNRYLQFDSGRSFFPIGLNIAWPHNDPGLDEYEQWFGKLSAGGGNFARVWMCHPNRMTETTEAGIGKFDLAAMQYYDEILEIARKNGIYVMFTLNNHRDLLARDEYGDSIWLRFPYNAANGGPATRPSDFINSKVCRDLYKRRLRYVIGRYSAFTNLAFWEFFNEQEFTRIDIPTDWLREMSEYLKTNDPYGRLVTESAKIPDDQWKLPSIDVTQAHLYVGGSTDLVGPVVASARRHDKFDKPHIVAELGIGGSVTEERHDPAGVGTALHQGIWASALSGCAGSSWHWWWDNYVAPKDLWHVYGGLSKFAAQVDWARRRFRPVELQAVVSPQQAAGSYFDLTLACTEGWGYILSGDVTVGVSGMKSQALPHYWVSPTKPDLYRPARLVVDLPRETRLILRISQVSDVAVLRVSLDDKPIVDFPFSALPGAPDQQRTQSSGDDPRATYKATFNVERSVEIPAGKHVVTISTIAGDWATLESIVFKDALSARYQLAALALADDSAGETIAWVYDTQAHWRNDREGVQPRKFSAATIDIPASGTRHTIEWWDTRGGTVIERSTATASENVLHLTIPDFTRDIALRVRAGE